jgi:hypothetical protein
MQTIFPANNHSRHHISECQQQEDAAKKTARFDSCQPSLLLIAVSFLIGRRITIAFSAQNFSGRRLNAAANHQTGHDEADHDGVATQAQFDEIGNTDRISDWLGCGIEFTLTDLNMDVWVGDNVLEPVRICATR